MRKFSYWLGCTICTIILVAVTAFIGCEQGPKFLKPTPDKEQISICLDSIVNPVFTSLADAIECQKTLKSNAFVDSVFLSMPPDILKNVYSVVSKRINYIQKSDLVGEWLKNRSIYDNLPPPGDVSNTNQTTTITTTTPTKIPGIVHEETTTVTEAPPTRVEEQPSGSYKDTIINGKHALVKQ